MSYVADEDVYRRFEKHNYVLSFIHCHEICVYIVFLLIIALSYVTSPCGVVVRCSRVEPMVPGSSPTVLFFSFFLFFPFFVLLFSINI